MEKRKFLKLSLYSFFISIVTFVVTYFCFHYLTDDGFTTIWHEEAGKPFVTNVLGTFATLMLFLSVASLLIMCVFCSNDKNKKV